MSYQSKAANKARSFNSIMHYINEKWAAEVIGMQVNPKRGPDLVDDNNVVEIKFKLVYPERYTHISWRVLGFQREYNLKETNRECYWGLGKYWLAKKIKDIRTKDSDELESMVTKRELVIVPWDWMNQFQVYKQSGKTNISEWENYLIFPKASKLPKIGHTQNVKKGIVYLAEGVNPNQFIFPS